MKSRNEKVYDEEIAPLLLQAAKICENNEMSFIARVEFDEKIEEGSGRTEVLTRAASIEQRLTHWAARCNGNVDSLFLTIKRWANKHCPENKNSIVLNLMD